MKKPPEIAILKYLNITPNEYKRLDNNPKIKIEYNRLHDIINDIGYNKKLLDVKSKWEFPQNIRPPLEVKINTNGIDHLLTYRLSMLNIKDLSKKRIIPILLILIPLLTLLAYIFIEFDKIKLLFGI